MSRLLFKGGRWHTYYLDGTKVPGVTTVAGVLDKGGMVTAAAREAATWAVLHRDAFDVMGEAEWQRACARAHQDVWAKARDDGTALHKIAETLVYGTPMPDQVDGVPVADHVADMAQWLARWFDAWQVEPVKHEGLVYSDRWQYAGRFDLVADLADGQRWLLDFKTTASGVWPETALQLAGYRHASHYVDDDGHDKPLAELGIERAGVVWVRPDHAWLVPVLADERVFGYFAHCRSLYAFRQWDKAITVHDPLAAPEEAAS